MARKFGQYQRAELGFDLDNFRDPAAYSNKDAWVRQIVHLCIMEPGTIASNPTIGIGIRRYDFFLEEERYKLQSKINDQVPKFFPDIPFRNCTVVATPEDLKQDILYLIVNLLISGNEETVVVAIKRSYHYIDYAIAS